MNNFLAYAGFFLLGLFFGFAFCCSNFGEQYFYYRECGFTVLNSLKRAYKVWK
jgi:hypothetical protein